MDLGLTSPLLVTLGCLESPLTLAEVLANQKSNQIWSLLHKTNIPEPKTSLKLLIQVFIPPLKPWELLTSHTIPSFVLPRQGNNEELILKSGKRVKHLINK